MRTLLFIPLFLLLFFCGNFLTMKFSVWSITVNWNFFIKIFILIPANLVVFAFCAWLPVLISASFSRGPLLAIIILRFVIVGVLIWRFFSTDDTNELIGHLIYGGASLWATRKKYVIELLHEQYKAKVSTPE